MNNTTKTKHKTLTNNGKCIKQWINNNRTTILERTAAIPMGGGLKGLKEFYWRQIFALEYVVVKAHTIVYLAWRLPN